MEELDILPTLQNEVILASLYVDDKEELPEAEQTKVDLGNGQMKRIKTIGDKWSMFQQVNFNNNSQPHYVLVTPEGKVINTPVSGLYAERRFQKFLECGIEFYKNRNRIINFMDKKKTQILKLFITVNRILKQFYLPNSFTVW